PCDRVLRAVDLSLQDRSQCLFGRSTGIRLYEFELVIQFFARAEISQSSGNGMLARDFKLCFLQHLILAVRSAVAAAEQVQEGWNRFGIFAANAPVQSDEAAAARGQTGERL